MKHYQLLNIFYLIQLFIILFFVNLNNAFAITCVENSRTCIEGAENRIISGTSIHKDCWNYTINYQCYEENNFTDNCAAIKQIPDCSQLSSNCQSHLADGACLSYLNQHVCSTEISNPSNLNLSLVNQDQHIITEILNDSECRHYASDSNCRLSTDSVCIEGPQSRLINGMTISRDCWAYQKQYNCKGGFINQCTDYQDNCQLQNQDCLSRDNNGVCTYNTNTYQCQSPATQTNVSCGSQDYITFNQDHNFGRAAASLGLLQGAAKEFNKDNMTTFSGSGSKCSKSAVSFNNCCSQSGWGNDLSLASCSSAEENLAVLRNNQRCVYVGSYCAKKVAGLCLSTKESYCCFNSKLSRIVNEQGRSQIGMDFGSAKSPNCAGILINDLQRIDFSMVDFSELFADFNANTPIPNNQVNSDRVSSTVQEYYQQSQNQGQNQNQGQSQVQNQNKSQSNRSKI